MYCPTCGKPVENGAQFCPVCGVKQATAAAPQQPMQQPVQQPAFLPPGMDYRNGSIHWQFVQNLKKDNRAIKIIELVYLVTLFVFGIIAFFSNLKYGFEDAVKMLLFVFFVPFIVLTVITLISWGILLAIKGGKNRLEFFMNEQQVMYCDTMQTFISRFSDVKSIKTHRKIHMIGVNGAIQKNTIYATDEQYEFVLNYICARCPQASKKLDS